MIIRRHRWILAITLFIVAPLAGLAIGAAAGVHMTYSTDIEPDITVETGVSTTGEVVLPNGKSVGLDQLAPGRRVAVVVMKDTDCPACSRQLQDLSERIEEVHRAGGAVFGLSDADHCTNQGVMHRLGLKFPIVSDQNHQVLEQFKMTLPERNHVMPGVLFVDERGHVDFVHKGRTPGQQQEDMILDRLRR